MRVLGRTRRATRSWRIALAVAALMLTGMVLATPGLADPRLERAEQEQEERQAALDKLLGRIDALEAQVDDTRTSIEEMEDLAGDQEREAAQLESQVRAQVRSAYMHGRPDPVYSLLLSDDPQMATDRARYLRMLAAGQQSDAEAAVASRVEAEAMAERLTGALAELETQQADLQEAKAEAQTLVAEAEAQVASVKQTIRREEEEARRRREAERQRSRLAASRSGSASTSSGPSGAIACPIGTPRSYSDTWGAARSGGRAHKGTDMLAPRGTPIYAYEAGTITRMHNNRLGGITLYLRGQSGHTYYYAHLSGYVGGLSTGQSVTAGQHIAFNGDSGNATGIPHLHIEVMPGGRGNVNPYPYMRRACG